MDVSWLTRLKQRMPTGYRDLAKVLGGTLVRNFLRGLFKLIVAGFLAPQALGILRSVLSFFRILCSFADLGLNYTLITFISRLRGSRDAIEQQRLLRLVLTLKIVMATLFLAVGNLLAGQITSVIFSDPSLTIYIRLVFLAVGGQLLWGYISSYLSAHQQFGRLGYFLVTMPALMLLCGVALIVVERFSLSTSLMIYLFAPALTALIWLPALGRHLGRWSSGWSGDMLRRVLRFSGWVYLESVASTTRNNINPLLLKNATLSGSLAAGELNAGLYSFGSDLANEIAIFSKSLLTVLLPKASSKSTPAELRRFVNKAHRHLLLLLVPLALLGFAAKPFILMLGTIKTSYLEYLPSLGVFAVLYAGALFSVASVPIRTVLYSLERPQVIVRIELITMVILVLGCVIIIPVYGSIGAAVMVFIQRVLGFLMLISWGGVILRRAEAEAI